ncbi:hypothetical protein E3U55_07290 [Filobacillus milosensis]|uniref:DUF4129 domain-containing protein n=1 Tax=Filobacillus milosensis TaxID=94137 RepID=A0A4Y8IP59_9BACI|nr:hypothetical protein [Filobacillus milosensis]TFB22098.1 hypothetical protein E3U55_07290 [Filobacillus milosensis]
MHNHNHPFIKSQKIVIEIFTLWILYFAYLILFKQEPQIISFLFYVTISIAIYLFLKTTFQEKLKLFHFISLTPLFFLIAWVSGLSIIASLFFSGFLVWRMIRHDDVAELETETTYIGIAIAATFLGHIIGVYQHSEYADGIVLMLVIQLSVLFVGKLIFHLFSQEGNSLKKRLYTFAFLIFLLFGGATLIYSAYPILRNIYYTAIHGVIGLFVTILRPLFKYVETIEPKEAEEEDEQEIEQGTGERPEDSLTERASEPVITSEHLMIAFFVVVTIILILIIYKKRHTLMKSVKLSDRNNDDFASTSNLTREKKLWKFRQGSKAPKNEVRKEFFKLEEWAAKKGIGRYKDESIHDYLQRYNIKHLVDDDVIQIYRNVRYGFSDIDSHNKNYYITQINQLKQHLKEYLKKEREEENNDQDKN